MAVDRDTRATSLGERAVALASEPMRDAGPRRAFFAGTWESVREIASQHQLLGLLVRRELKSRYKDSVLGFVWSLIRPLAMLAVYFIVLGKVLHGGDSIPDFAIFIFSGLTAWTFFSEALLTGTSSIVGNSGLVKKVYLPREVFPLATIGSALFNFSMQLCILVAATVAVGRFPTGSRWAYLPLSLAVLLVFTTALVFLLSAANVGLRDIQYLVDVALLILMWASPIVYSWGLVGQHIGGTPLENIYLANPVTLVALGFQKVFWVAGSNQPMPTDLAGRLWIALGVGVVLLWLCQRVFAQMQRTFAQEL